MTPHEWAALLERVADVMLSSPLLQMMHTRDAALLRTLATAMREAKQVGAPAPSWTTVDVEGRVTILKLPEAP